MGIKRRLIMAAEMLGILIAVSILGYRLLGGPQVTFLQALYMVVITLAGVGYGEIIDTTHLPHLRIFNIAVIVMGWVITGYVLASITAFLVEGDFSDVFRRRKMLTRISELNNHFVVCGMGDTGRHAVAELQKTGTPYVVVEAHEDHVKRVQEHTGDELRGMLYIIGDATDEEVLEQAGITRAAGLVTTLPHDKENLVITVLVRQKNPNIRIVARCTDLKFTERMEKAGADSVVSPNRIGGMRLVSEMVRPHVVGFLDLMLKEQGRTLRIEEVVITEGSPWVGRAFGELDLRNRYNLLPMAIKNSKDSTSKQNFWVNPPDALKLQAGVVIIVMGDVGDIRHAREDAKKSASIFAAKG